MDAGTAVILTQIAPTVYQDLAQPTVRKVGEALSLVIDFGSNYFTHLLDKQKILLDKGLREYAEHIKGVSEDKIISVPPEIGIPILQRLTYTTNDDIAKLFVNLLASASFTNTVEFALPRFVSIIENISADEALMISYMRNKSVIPYFVVQAKGGDNTVVELDKPITGLDIKVLMHSQTSSPKNTWIYFDNLVSLGILADKWGEVLSDKTLYQDIESLYGNKEFFLAKMSGDLNPKGGGQEFFINCHKDNPLAKNKEIIFKRSYYKITELGKKFVSCCTTETIL